MQIITSSPRVEGIETDKWVSWPTSSYRHRNDGSPAFAFGSTVSLAHIVMFLKGSLHLKLHVHRSLDGSIGYGNYMLDRTVS